jgi:hypothetical protein
MKEQSTLRNCYIVQNPMFFAFDLIIIITIFFSQEKMENPYAKWP